jgi:hypothetical protein
MLIDSGSLSAKDRKPVGALWMSDACSLTRDLVGDEEFDKQDCRDDLVDSRVPVLARKDSIQFYFQECNRFLKTYGESLDQNWEGEVRPERVSLNNLYRGDGEFGLRFESGAYHFVCEGQISSVDHVMRVFAWDSRNSERRIASASELTDACTLTREAFGEREWLGECHDKTQRERNIETGLGLAWHALWAGLGLRDIYRFIRKRPTLTGRMIRAVFHPIRTLSGMARTVGRGLNAVRAAGAWLWNSRGAAALRTLLPRATAAFGSMTLAAQAARASLGGAIVKGADFIAGKFFDDYDKSVAKRTTDRVYDKWVYSFEGVRKMEHWYDVFAVPLMPFRWTCRWLAPNSMNRAVTSADENAPIREQVLAEDREACDKNLNYMKAVFVALKDEPAEVQEEFQRSLLEGLSQPAAASQAEGELKNLIGSIQEGAQFILKIKQNTDTINWVREVFNADGTLKAGMEKKFLEKVGGTPPAETRGIA